MSSRVDGLMEDQREWLASIKESHSRRAAEDEALREVLDFEIQSTCFGVSSGFRKSFRMLLVMLFNT